MVRLLLGLFGVAIAGFAFWASWELVRQIPSSPQAGLGALAFAVAACVALGATASGVSTRMD